jgi:hypothetical protein
MFRQVTLAGAPIFLAAALAAAPAHSANKEKPAAASEKLAVVDLDVPPGMLGLSIQVTKAIVAEATRQKFTVITPDELREKLGNKTLNELMKCADRPLCAQDKLGPLGATRAVLGRLSRDERNYVLQLYLLDLNKLTLVTDVDRNILIASRRFQKDVEAAIPGFLRGEREAHGTLTINSTVTNTEISLNGDFMGIAPVTTTLKPGKYELKAEKKHYLPVKRFIDIEPNKNTVEEVRMLLVPGEKPEDEFVPPLSAGISNGQGGTNKGQGFRLTPPTIIAGIAALIAGGVGIGFGVVTNGMQSNLLQGYNASKDTYAGTRAQALTAKTDAYVANTLFIVAGVALIATIVLAVFDGLRPAEGETRVDVTPPGQAPAPAPAPDAAPAGGTP